MLGNARVRPILPTIDLQRAIKFYEETLGLRVTRREQEPSQGAVVQAGDDTSLYLYERSRTKADHTVAGFVVADVEAVVDGLKRRGVVFEEYDSPDLKTTGSIAVFRTSSGEAKAAWFKDTEGNVLDVTDFPL